MSDYSKKRKLTNNNKSTMWSALSSWIMCFKTWKRRSKSRTKGIKIGKTGKPQIEMTIVMINLLVVSSILQFKFVTSTAKKWKCKIKSVYLTLRQFVKNDSFQWKLAENNIPTLFSNASNKKQDDKQTKCMDGQTGRHI